MAHHKHLSRESADDESKDDESARKTDIETVFFTFETYTGCLAVFFNAVC